MSTNFGAPLGRMAGWDVSHVPQSTAADDLDTSAEAPAPPISGMGTFMSSKTNNIAPAPNTSETAPEEEASPPDRPSASDPNGSMGPLPSLGENRPVPSGSAMAQVRFLNAVTDDGLPLRITLGNQLLSSFLSPDNLSGYFTVAVGFRPLIFYDARFPWMILFRTNLPLAAGDVITLAVVRSAAGLNLVRIDDRAQNARGTGRSCVRCINLIYDSPGLDVVLTDGRVVFTDVRFKEVTTCRRAKPGQYDMYVAQTPQPFPQGTEDIETVEEMPIAVSSYFLPGSGAMEPLSSFSSWGPTHPRGFTPYMTN